MFRIVKLLTISMVLVLMVVSAYARDLYALLAIGNGYSNNRENVIAQGATNSKDQFVEMLSSMESMNIYDDVHIIVVEGRSLTSNTLKNALDRINPRRDKDDIFFTFIGHGGASQSRGRYYKMADGSCVWKSQVDNVIESKDARQTIIFNESCAHISSSLGSMGYVDASDEDVEKNDVWSLNINYDNLRRLFSGYKGVFDFSSSTLGQLSWLLNSGGIASTSLIDVLTGQEPVYSWGDVVDKLESRIEKKFRLYLAQGVFNENQIDEDEIQIPEVNDDTTTKDNSDENSDNPDTGNTSADDVSEDDFVDWD
jgi:hypothetical protein